MTVEHLLRAHSLRQNCSFSPDEIVVVDQAYKDTLRALGVRDRTEPIAVVAAKAIMESARTGERDRAKLRGDAVRELKL
jgi:hypothetical protein